MPLRDGGALPPQPRRYKGAGVSSASGARAAAWENNRCLPSLPPQGCPSPLGGGRFSHWSHGDSQRTPVGFTAHGQCVDTD
ncbi:hypothetical protein MRX96_059321 [Rhipicephalus microplus]